MITKGLELRASTHMRVSLSSVEGYKMILSHADPEELGGSGVCIPYGFHHKSLAWFPSLAIFFCTPYTVLYNVDRIMAEESNGSSPLSLSEVHPLIS